MLEIQPNSRVNIFEQTYTYEIEYVICIIAPAYKFVTLGISKVVMSCIIDVL